MQSKERILSILIGSGEFSSRHDSFLKDEFSIEIMEFLPKLRRDLEWFQEYIIKWMTVFAIGVGGIFTIIGFIGDASFKELAIVVLLIGLMMLIFVIKKYYKLAASLFFVGLSAYILMDGAIRRLTGNLDYLVVILVASGILINLRFTIGLGISTFISTLILTALGYFDWLPVMDTETGLYYVTSISAAATLQILGILLALIIRRVIMNQLGKLQRSEENLQSTLQSIGEGVIITDASGEIVMANQEISRLSEKDISKIESVTIYDLFDIHDEQSSQRIKKNQPPILEAKGGSMSDSVTIINHKDDKYICEFTTSEIENKRGELLGYVTVLRDVTYRRGMFKEIVKNQKNKSIKILSGGIAHDFNNILTRIVGTINVMKLEDTSPSIDSLIEDLEQATNAAKRLTDQLMNFSRGLPLSKEKVSFDELIRETTEFMIKGSNVETVYEFDKKLWEVAVDQGQIEQVIQNIILNSIQAIEDKGKIIITAENVVLQKHNLCNLPEGKYLRVSITDTGPGIPQQALPHVFDPYFTTKEDGHGIGLAICNTIIKNHAGTMNVENTEDAGARFYFYLPAMDRDL